LPAELEKQVSGVRFQRSSRLKKNGQFNRERNSEKANIE